LVGGVINIVCEHLKTSLQGPNGDEEIRKVRERVLNRCAPVYEKAILALAVDQAVRGNPSLQRVFSDQGLRIEDLQRFMCGQKQTIQQGLRLLNGAGIVLQDRLRECYFERLAKPSAAAVQKSTILVQGERSESSAPAVHSLQPAPQNVSREEIIKTIAKHLYLEGSLLGIEQLTQSRRPRQHNRQIVEEILKALREHIVKVLGTHSDPVRVKIARTQVLLPKKGMHSRLLLIMAFRSAFPHLAELFPKAEDLEQFVSQKQGGIEDACRKRFSLGLAVWERWNQEEPVEAAPGKITDPVLSAAVGAKHSLEPDIASFIVEDDESPPKRPRT
jgi:hypothetical protein